MDSHLRQIVTFECEGETLVGTLDDAAGATGILIVSGGNEVRWGTCRAMALLAGRLSGAGIPTFRFDRRGVGDSSGENLGYAASIPDIAAALATFRDSRPHLTRVIGFGNCDAAVALLLHPHRFDALVLANPWLGNETAPPPPAAIRAGYARALRDPRAWLRLISPARLGRFSREIPLFFRTSRQPLTQQVTQALAKAPPTLIVLAKHDRSAQIFAAAISLPDKVRCVEIDTHSHGFVDAIEPLTRILIESARG